MAPPLAAPPLDDTKHKSHTHGYLEVFSTRRPGRPAHRLHILDYRYTKYVTHRSDDKLSTLGHLSSDTRTNDPASPPARARSTPPFADAPRRVDNHGGACSRDDSLERVFIAPATRACGDHTDRARDARGIIVRARRARGSRADLLERTVASRALSRVARSTNDGRWTMDSNDTVHRRRSPYRRSSARARSSVETGSQPSVVGKKSPRARWDHHLDARARTPREDATETTPIRTRD